MSFRRQSAAVGASRMLRFGIIGFGMALSRSHGARGGHGAAGNS